MKRWRKLSHGGARVFGDVENFEHLSPTVREHLRAAGIDRPDLYSKGDVKGAFGTHSFRRSFVTRCLANQQQEDYSANALGT